MSNISLTTMAWVQKSIKNAQDADTRSFRTQWLKNLEAAFIAQRHSKLKKRSSSSYPSESAGTSENV